MPLALYVSLAASAVANIPVHVRPYRDDHRRDCLPAGLVASSALRGRRSHRAEAGGDYGRLKSGPFGDDRGEGRRLSRWWTPSLLVWGRACDLLVGSYQSSW